MMTRDQQVNDCLVCGADDEVKSGAPPLDEELAALLQGLRDDHERRWVRRIEGCGDGDDRLFRVAHFLWSLRKDPCYKANLALTERLLYAIGLTFPATGPRPETAPFIGGPPPPSI